MMTSRSYRLFGMAMLTVSIIVGIELFIYSSHDNKTEDENFRDKFNEDYRVYSVTIPEDLAFCGEEVPLFDADVLERIDRELLVNTYWQSNTMLYHKRASKWFPVIEPILKENGVPDDFKYLALVESGLTNSVSPSGAAGFWQMLPKTGQEYGLEVTDEVDERYDVAKATQATCKYLKAAHDRYGNWTLAAASYNMGMNGIDRQLKRQEAGNYYDLLLNDETSRYVFRVIAAKEILEHPTRYGFHYRLKDLYQPHETYSVKLDTAVKDLAQYASKHKVNYKILKIFNPWLRQSYLTNKSGKRYTILLPKKGYHDFSTTLFEVPADSIAPTSDTLQLKEGDE